MEKAWGGGGGPICAWLGPPGPDWLDLLSWSNMALHFPQISSQLGAKVGTGKRESLPTSASLPRSHRMGQVPLTSGATETKGIWRVLRILPWLPSPVFQMGTDGRWSVLSLPHGP